MAEEFDPEELEKLKKEINDEIQAYLKGLPEQDREEFIKQGKPKEWEEAALKRRMKIGQ